MLLNKQAAVVLGALLGFLAVANATNNAAGAPSRALVLSSLRTSDGAQSMWMDTQQTTKRSPDTSTNDLRDTGEFSAACLVLQARSSCWELLRLNC